MCTSRVAFAFSASSTLHRNGRMATWARLWKASVPTLFQMILVAVLMSPVVGDCGPPPTLLFASPINILYETTFKPGTILKYTCHHGYRKVNSSHLTCDINDEWTYNVFCTKKQCKHPGELTNGKIEILTDLIVGSAVEFTCAKGYLLIGPTTSKCEVQGKGVGWSDPLPECVIIKCESPPVISNGKHRGGDEDLYTYGSSVTYSCDPPFTLVGNATISCMVVNKTIGVWSSSPPACKKTVCLQPQIPKGIIVSGFRPFYTYKDSIQISCKKGYILRGSSLIHCEMNKEWFPSVPTCQLNGCSELPEIPYAYWEKSIFLQRNLETFEVGTELKYHCKPGYRAISTEPQSVTCQENFTWRHSKGCEKVCCPTPNLEKIRIISERRDFTGICAYAYEDYVFYMCDEGYYPLSIDGRSSCHADGKWVPKIPSCVSAVCGKPEIKNGKLSVEKNQYFEMENVTIHCNPGYVTVGPQTITCTENKNWHPEVPRCEREILEGCEQVIAGQKLMQCLSSPKDVKRALELYKMSLEIEQLEKEKEKDKQVKIRQKFPKHDEKDSFLPLN
ncbi:zona pellucida sperm-binding protein 3 receptor-like [Castor canadensis]|uniref:Zona pellucida sperm-binding protein 3 receptor n=1 Tax=Castor canadensis TaxID=51338 RepID=A0A8B7TTS0_CASCN